MLASKAFLLGTIAFAFFSIYALFYSLYMTQLKFHETSSTNLLTQDNSTWFQPKVKVVMVIIDALRFDYLLNYENIDHDPALQVNKFERFNKAYFKYPNRFVVFRARADVPTMTVLRVPCLMTGNVPRLGSVLTAFGALPAEEDSIPRQLYIQNKKTYYAGDPILKEYFPKYLESDYQLGKAGSFNVLDRNADKPTHEAINNALAKNEFDFLGTHFLRLDHMGHSSGLASPQVLHAIQEIDRYLIHLMKNIDNNTMLLFTGDHGTDKTGTHGGGSPQETTTAIVAYYKKGFMKYKHKNRYLKKVMRSVNETHDQVSQIDFAPTLAMLMGLRTPFSNMGQILNDLYPVGDYLSKQDCPHAGFEMQMLHDSHLNTLQIWNYFKKYHEGQDLFTGQEYSKISSQFKKIEAAYKTADQMISENRQCEESLHKIASNAIKKSQKFSKEVHELVATKAPHDLVIFWQGFTILALVGVSYLLLVQYISKTKDYEHITWNLSLKNWKNLIPITILFTVIWMYNLANDQIIKRPITSSALILAINILGSSIKPFLFNNKPKEIVSLENESSSIEDKPKDIISLETESPTIENKSFFSFKSFSQNPLITVGAVMIIGSLFFLTHVISLDKFDISRKKAYAPYVFVLLVGARLSGRYLKLSPFIMTITVMLVFGLGLAKVHDFWSNNGIITMGLLLIADWLWSEIQFTMFKLRAGKIWSFHYLIGFIILVFYHLLGDPKTDFVKVTLHQVMWCVLIASCLASFALRKSRRMIKRNLQINLVLFFTLMQLHRKLLFFGIVLSLMSIVTFIFKRTQFKNYLYPLFLGLISYVGLFSISFSDRRLPRTFEPAFVGIKDFHLVLVMFLYGSAMSSTIILGMLFMSFYGQDLELQDVELGIQKEESDCHVVALKGYSGIIKKRNIILYSLFYGLIMLGAAINPVILTNHKKVYLSLERFLVDATLYLFTINIVYFMT